MILLFLVLYIVVDCPTLYIDVFVLVFSFFVVASFAGV